MPAKYLASIRALQRLAKSNEIGFSMTVRKMIYLGLAMALIAIAYVGWKFTARSAYESAEYKVLESDGPFELREYGDVKMATTSMNFKSQGDDGSFMRLFRYIDGANEDKQKVAMTTPVFMESATSDAGGQMGFVIPKKIAEEHVPEPSDANIQIRTRVGGRFAVIRFAGRMKEDSIAAVEEKLRKWIAEKGWTSDGDAEYAGYDPPWTPGPFRRNEVLIRLK
jgi:SOUL heme-binding protein